MTNELCASERTLDVGGEFVEARCDLPMGHDGSHEMTIPGESPPAPGHEHDFRDVTAEYRAKSD